MVNTPDPDDVGHPDDDPQEAQANDADGATGGSGVTNFTAPVSDALGDVLAQPVYYPGIRDSFSFRNRVDFRHRAPALVFIILLLAAAVSLLASMFAAHYQRFGLTQAQGSWAAVATAAIGLAAIIVVYAWRESRDGRHSTILTISPRLPDIHSPQRIGALS